MSEFEQKLVNYSAAAEQNYASGAIGQNINPSQYMPRPEEVEEQRKYAVRYHRMDALRMAYEMLKGADIVSDHQAVIRAARDMLAFINDG